MKGKDLTTNTTIATTHPDNTILTAIVKPRNILIVIGLMAVFIYSPSTREDSYNFITFHAK